MVAIGGHGVYIPYHTTWAHEVVNEEDVSRDTYVELGDIRQLPELLKAWDRSENN